MRRITLTPSQEQSSCKKLETKLKELKDDQRYCLKSETKLNNHDTSLCFITAAVMILTCSDKKEWGERIENKNKNAYRPCMWPTIINNNFVLCAHLNTLKNDPPSSRSS